MKTTIFSLMMTVLFWSAPVALADKTRFNFMAMGDIPYGEAAHAPFQQLISRVNALQPAFSLHIGDIKSGSSVCSDEEFARIHGYFMRFEQAIIYTPGDNEWTDCHRPEAGEFQPLERLAVLREMFFSDANSLGKNPMRLERQADVSAHQDMVENATWKYGDVRFVSAHIVGSNNSLERNETAVKEYFQRDAANVEWLQRAFQQAKAEKAKAMVIAFHAEMFFGTYKNWQYENGGFKNSLAAIIDGAKSFARPILLIHGDYHEFIYDRPLRDANGERVDNVWRLEVMGASTVGAVNVGVDTDTAGVFSVTPVLLGDTVQ